MSYHTLGGKGNLTPAEAPTGATRPSEDSGDVFGNYHNGNTVDDSEAGEEDDIFGDYEVATRARSSVTSRASTETEGNQ